MAPEPLEAMHELRTFMFERVYMSDTAAGQKHVAIDVIRRLVDHHLAHPELIPETYRDTEADEVTQVVDYVSGMTDRFALTMHDRLFDADATVADDPAAARAVTEVEVVTLIRAAADRVFDLELDADVHAASMAASGETATTSTGRPALGLGDEVTFTARHLGRSWRLTSRITEVDRPRRFVDEQVSGPFRRMRHEHLFETAGEATDPDDRPDRVHGTAGTSGRRRRSRRPGSLSAPPAGTARGSTYGASPRADRCRARRAQAPDAPRRRR